MMPNVIPPPTPSYYFALFFTFSIKVLLHLNDPLFMELAINVGADVMFN